MEQTFNLDVFSQHLNTKFRVDLGEQQGPEIELIEAERRPSPPTQDIFSLTFQGPLDSPFPQQMYDVEHDVLGKFPLFLVPVGKDEKGYFYEAVFNRFIRKES